MCSMLAVVVVYLGDEDTLIFRIERIAFRTFATSTNANTKLLTDSLDQEHLLQQLQCTVTLHVGMYYLYMQPKNVLNM